MTRRTYSLPLASVLCLIGAVNGVVYTPVESAISSRLTSLQATPPPCTDGASPGIIQLTADPSQAGNGLKLARKRFFLSSVPFNLLATVNLKTAPSLRSYYQKAGASPQFIHWLEENHCDTVYCRELSADEVNCGPDSPKCVPEFVNAYNNALAKLSANQELARKLVTNYEPLSSSRLRIGFYEAKTAWLKGAVEAIERGFGNNHKINSTITDKDGIAFFYDLCPGTYYVSSIAPIEIDGAAIFWDTDKPIKVEGPPDVNRAIIVTLAFPPGKDKKNFFVGKPVSEISQ